MRDININSIRAVDRAIDILNVFTADKPSLNIDEITAASKLAKATAYRILYTLELRGLIHYDPKTLQYKLGLKLLEYAGILTSMLDVRQESEDILIELQMKTQQTVLMAVPEGDSMVYVFKRENPEGLKYSSYLGQRRPIGFGVLGRLITAYLPEEQSERILNQNPVASKTTEGKQDIVKVKQLLQDIRNQGYYVEINETVMGVTGISAPVFNAEGKIIAALGIVGPSVQLADEKLEIAKKMVISTAEQISLRMGHRPASVPFLY